MNPVVRALWYIERHYTEALSLDRVAEAAGLSRFHLSGSSCAVVCHVLVSLVLQLQRPRLAR